jgi:hypothetical protein
MLDFKQKTVEQLASKIIAIKTSERNQNKKLKTRGEKHKSNR